MKKQFTRSKLCVIALFAVAALWQSCSKDNLQVIGDTEKEAPIRPITASSNAYVTDLFEFNPAPGQFINTDLGNEKGAQSTLKSNNGLVSLGAWGGNIVIGFDHTVLDADGKADLIVYGNGFAGFAEPGVIWVMQDTNGNGKPDDKWYEIQGSAYYQEGYVRNYEVTYTKPACDTCSVHWTDNKGKTGVVQTNVFHKQAYYPASVKTDTYTLKGTLLPSTNINMSNPSYITSGAFDYGYSDNKAGGDKIDIASAIDERGNKVNLKGIDFIKVQTGIQANMGSLGEQSTEFTGAADLSLLK